LTPASRSGPNGRGRSRGSRLNETGKAFLEQLIEPFRDIHEIAEEFSPLDSEILHLTNVHLLEVVSMSNLDFRSDDAGLEGGDHLLQIIIRVEVAAIGRVRAAPLAGGEDVNVLYRLKVGLEIEFYAIKLELPLRPSPC